MAETSRWGETTKASAANDASLLPSLRPRIEIERQRLAQQQGHATTEPLFHPLANELAVILLRKRAEHWEQVESSALETLGISFEAALKQGLRNHKRRFGSLLSIEGFSEVEPGIRTFAGGFDTDVDFEAGQALFHPQAFLQLGLNTSPLVFAPTRTRLYVVDGEVLDSHGTTALVRCARLALRDFQKSESAKLSPIPMTLVDRRWTPFFVSQQDPANEIIRACWMEYRRHTYAQLGEALAQHAESTSPVNVPYQTRSKVDEVNGAIGYAYATLTVGEKLLVPKVEWLQVQRTGSLPHAGDQPVAHASSFLVPWSAVTTVCGPIFSKQSYYPETFFVELSPSNEQWGELYRRRVDPTSLQPVHPAATEFTDKSPAPEPMLEAEALHAVPAGKPEAITASGPPHQVDNKPFFWMGGLAIGGIVFGLLLMLAIGVVAIMYFNGRAWHSVFDHQASMETQLQSPPQRGSIRSSTPTRIRPPTFDTPSFSPPISIPSFDFDSDYLPPPEAPDHDPAEVAIPFIAISESEISEMGQSFHQGNQTFESRAPDGGLLVGLQVGMGSGWGGSINGIRPIYQVGDEYRNGVWCGAGDLTDVATLMADDGYAIGTISLSSGIVINQLQVEYFEVSENGKLDPGSRIPSPILGGRGGSKTVYQTNGGTDCGAQRNL